MGLRERNFMGWVSSRIPSASPELQTLQFSHFQRAQEHPQARFVLHSGVFEGHTGGGCESYRRWRGDGKPRFLGCVEACSED